MGVLKITDLSDIELKSPFERDVKDLCGRTWKLYMRNQIRIYHYWECQTCKVKVSVIGNQIHDQLIINMKAQHYVFKNHSCELEFIRQVIDQ